MILSLFVCRSSLLTTTTSAPPANTTNEGKAPMMCDRKNRVHVKNNKTTKTLWYYSYLPCGSSFFESNHARLPSETRQVLSPARRLAHWLSKKRKKNAETKCLPSQLPAFLLISGNHIVYLIYSRLLSFMYNTQFVNKSTTGMGRDASPNVSRHCRSRAGLLPA